MDRFKSVLDDLDVSPELRHVLEDCRLRSCAKVSFSFSTGQEFAHGVNELHQKNGKKELSFDDLQTLVSVYDAAKDEHVVAKDQDSFIPADLLVPATYTTLTGYRREPERALLGQAPGMGLTDRSDVLKSKPFKAETSAKRAAKKLDMAIDDRIKGSSIKQTEKARKKKWVVPLNEILRIACEACRTQGIKEPKIYLDCKDAT